MKSDNLIKFDIESAPPSDEALAVERARLAGLSNRLSYRIADRIPAWLFACGLTLTAFSAVLVVSTGVALVAGAEGAAASVFLASIATTGFLASGLVFLVHAGGLMYEISRRKYQLIPLDLDKCEEIVQWCVESREVATYQAAVAQQGRMLVEGEYWAMDAWMGSANQRAEFSRKLASCEALRMPVMAS